MAVVGGTRRSYNPGPDGNGNENNKVHGCLGRPRGRMAVFWIRDLKIRLSGVQRMVVHRGHLCGDRRPVATDRSGHVRGRVVAARIARAAQDSFVVGWHGRDPGRRVAGCGSPHIHRPLFGTRLNAQQPGLRWRPGPDRPVRGTARQSRQNLLIPWARRDGSLEELRDDAGQAPAVIQESIRSGPAVEFVQVPRLHLHQEG